MMKPNAMRRYVPKMDEIAEDFIHKMYSMRGSNDMLPEDFLLYLRKWSLEAICQINFDLRIGLLGDKEDPVANKFLRNVTLIFEHSYQLDVLPSIWKLFKTPLFKEAMKNLDELNE